MTVAGNLARYVGALTLLGVGAVHIDQYTGVYYSVIPVIGPLFLLNFAFATVVGLALLAPVQRLPRFGPWLPALLALTGIGISVGAIVSVVISESSTLFGFHEAGYRAAIDVALALEALTILLLGFHLAQVVRTPPRTHAEPATA